MTAQRDFEAEGFTLQEMIDMSLDLRTQAQALDQKLKEIKQQRNDLEFVILETMDAQGLSRTGTDKANISVQEKNLPSVTDWDAFYNYIASNNYFHLLQRRVSAKAVEEAATTSEDGEVPGIEFFTQRKVTLRAK